MEEQDPPIVMLRAELTREQLKQLRRLALEDDQTMQKLVGDVLARFLEAERKNP